MFTKTHLPDSSLLCHIIVFFLYIEVQLINNLVLVSGVQQSESVTHIHESIHFQIFFKVTLLWNIEQSSLYYTIGPCWLSVLNTAVYT